MRKLTFERAILIVLIAIIFISTTEIREKFIDRYRNKDISYSEETQSGKNQGFPTMFLTADKLYNEGNYEAAINEYLTLTLNTVLSIEQKSRANFRLGICQYNLKSYKLAFDSFVKASSFNPSDSIIYNNAAVSAYNAKDIESAIEYQTKALEILPAVEYYYNLARMYEDDEQYELAVINYLTVAKAEQNLTETDKIDPVRIKEKIARLMPNSQSPVVSNVLRVYKLKNTMDKVLTVGENEMQLKQGDFIVKVENQKLTKNIIAEYDRKKYDPYNLITEMLWTIYRDGKQIYKRSSDKISLNTAQGGNYEVKLNIKYNGNKENISSKIVRINNNESTIDIGKQDEITVKPPISVNTRTYEYAVYEQLFENNFDIKNNGYTDRFNVVWGKDVRVETQPNKKLAMDKVTSLIVDNQSNTDAGLWINLDSLLKEETIKGKTINISFYARAITDNADLNISVRVKSNNMIATTPKKFSLAFQFEQKSISIYIPEDASGFTLSIKTNSLEKFNIDRFVIVD